MTAGFTVRTARPDDVAGIQRVSAATGQPPLDSGADADYVLLVLRTGTALVAVDDGERALAWAAARTHAFGTMVSDLFVHPDNQGVGIGRSLLAELRRRAGATPFFTFSSRHPSALPVYARAGLIPAWPLIYLSGTNPGYTGPLTAELVDAADAATAEAQLTDVRRNLDYEFWLRLPSSAAFVVREGARLVASSAVRAGALLHLCCPLEQDAAGSLACIFAACGTDRVSACIPGSHPALPTLLQSAFLIDDYDIAMATGGVRLPSSWAYSPGLG